MKCARTTRSLAVAIIVIVGCVGTVVGRAVTGVTNSQVEPPGGMSLLPGYGHERFGGLDSRIGRIAKSGGPLINYEIGFNSGMDARTYAERHSKAWMITQRHANGSQTLLAMDEGREVLVVTISGFANFQAEHVKTRREMAEVLLMLMSYDAEKDLVKR